MRVKVNADLCVGCGLCVDISPDVFIIKGDKAVVKGNPVPEEAGDSCRQAKQDCPVEAIAVEE
ncbi:MAG: ferredoxin [Candidatus Omnitrophota bacterium]